MGDHDVSDSDDETEEATVTTDAGSGETVPSDDESDDGEAVTGSGSAESHDDTSAGDDREIEAKVDRVREIVDELESGEPGLAEAKRLRDEGKRLLAELRATLDPADSGPSGDEEAEHDGSSQDHDEEEGTAQDDEHPGAVSVEHAFGVVRVWFAGRDVHGESPRGCRRRTSPLGPN
ncbi:hypothetical protein BRD18_08335 [Halobacteriales archaeon SW_7_71_33]|nr:MAG: hypothetical protein BRD18_08335 [Halobacteriales archaeon SW_7_71_33]